MTPILCIGNLGLGPPKSSTAGELQELISPARAASADDAIREPAMFSALLKRTTKGRYHRANLTSSLSCEGAGRRAKLADQRSQRPRQLQGHVRRLPQTASC